MLSLVSLLVFSVQALPSQQTSQNGQVVARNRPIRVAAEYEPVSACLLGWKGYDNEFTQIAKACVLGGAKVFAVNGPAAIDGIAPHMYQRIHNNNLDSPWMRNYGPISLIKDNQPVLGDAHFSFARSQLRDNRVVSDIATATGLATYPIPLVLDGGNFITDTQGIAYTTSNLYRQNIPPFNMQARNQLHAKLKEHLGVKVLRDFDYPGSPNEPKDGLGNIDSFVKLLSDDTVLISINNPLDLNEIGNKVANEFRTLKTSNRTNDNVLTLYGFFISGKWHSYTRSLIVNNVVIVPSFPGKEDYEQKYVLPLFQNVYPDKTIVQVKFGPGIVSMGGSIRSFTQTIARVQ